MNQCSNCGALVGETDAFCGECGQPLNAQPAPGAAAELPSPADAGPDAPALSLPVPATSPAGPARSRRARLWLYGAATAALMACVCLAGIMLVVWQRSNLDDTSPTRQAASQQGPAEGALLFEDDFEDPNSGWDVYSENDTEAGYTGGEYRLAVNKPNFVTWANPADGNEFGDFMFEADVRLVEGPLNNNIGLVVRYQGDDENFYWFEISSDGFYSVDLLRADQWVTLVDWQASDAIYQGVGAVNHLQVVCDGSQLRFYANGAHLTDVDDTAFDRGNIGVGAGVFDEAGLVVHFDNVRVYRLKE